MINFVGPVLRADWPLASRRRTKSNEPDEEPDLVWVFNPGPETIVISDDSSQWETFTGSDIDDDESSLMTFDSDGSKAFK